MARAPEITRAQRLRRVCIIATNFARNMAYYRASRNNGDRLLPQQNFWINLEGNCIDVAVLEWCKLFAENTGRHSWRRVVADADEFEVALLNTVRLTPEQFDEVIQEVRTYRDRFIAHLDNELTMHIPTLDPLLEATRFYFSQVINSEMSQPERLQVGLTDLDEYYQQCHDEASLVFTAHQPEAR